MRNRALLIVIAAILLLPACVPDFHPPVSPSSSYSYRIRKTATAARSNGLRYFTWDECPEGANAECRIALTWSRAGELNPPVYVTPPDGMSYTLPDVAVDKDDKAYLVWVKIDYNDSGKRWGCVLYYDIGDPLPLECTPLPVESIWEIADYPVVANNPSGKDVFVVYRYMLGSLYYRRLQEGYEGEDALLDHGEYTNLYFEKFPDIAVDDVYRALFATYLAEVPEDGLDPKHYLLGYVMISSSVYYQHTDFSQRVADIQPSITIYYTDTDTPHAYMAALTSGGIPFLRSDFGDLKGFMSTTNWFSTWRPDVIVNSQGPLLVFSARRTGGGEIMDYEIWRAQFGHDMSFDGDNQITNDDVDEAEPKAAMVNGKEVIAWRKYPEYSVGANAAGDVYIYDTDNGIRKVFTNLYHPAAPAEIDLDANGMWVSGIWVDLASNNGLAVPWFSLNYLAQHTYIPVVQK